MAARKGRLSRFRAPFRIEQRIVPLNSPSEAGHQQRQHQAGVVTQVLAKLELVQISRQVLLRDADIGAIDPALNEVPEAFDRVGRTIAFGALASPMIEDQVVVIHADETESPEGVTGV